MSRTSEKVVTFEVAGIAGQVEVIGALNYYRVAQAAFLPWAGRVCFHTIRWSPRVSHMGATMADPPVQSATLGAGVVLAPARCSIWLVPTGGVVLTTANLVSPEQNCFTLYPGGQVDVGGWFGDLILAEGPGTAPDEAWDWQDGTHQAALGPALEIVIDNAIEFIGGPGHTVFP